MSTAAAMATDRPLSLGLVENQKNPLPGESPVGVASRRPLMPTAKGGGTPPLRVTDKGERASVGKALVGGIGRRGSSVGRRAAEELVNARVVVQKLCPMDDTEETTDPADMAHGVRYQNDEKGSGLKPARQVDGHSKKRRRYHTSCMCGPEDHRVSVESAIEESEARRARLMRELGEVAGITDGYTSPTVGSALGAFGADMSGDDIRRVLQPETHQKEN